MHKEILQSPWLCELIALHINLRETKAKPREASALFYGCYLTFNDGKPSLTCELFDSVKIDFDLTCSIRLKAANPKEKCPLCREGRVYEDAVHLEELNTLLGRRYDTNYSISKWYWEQRLQMERVERVKQVKEHWETQCRAFMGI
ncbi:E3 ubiquitin-protein ligase BAH1 [Glycine soja]|uniref:E3 ubiquitin-protein ligase BAH1 n=1 Tax=Glycine soja TaxID=3848 RepID=A0A0B2SIM0_GLYSO|nr:E3 ubiquitin-protein ligase BAH1 [Glycine soja]